MRKKVIKELTKHAANRLTGQVDALEFILETQRQQLIREQETIAKLAVRHLAHGYVLESIFDDVEDRHHIMRLIKAQDRDAFKIYFPDGFKESNSVIDGNPPLRANTDQQSA